MKKTLLASLLALSFAGSANAAQIPATSLTLGQSVVVNFTETTQRQVFEFASVGTTIFEFNLTSGSPSNITFRFYEDFDGDSTNGSVTSEIDPGALNLTTPTNQFTLQQPSGLISALIPMAGSTNWFLVITADSTPEGSATMTVNSVPVPAAAWLFGSALFGAGALRRKQKTA